MLLGTSTTEQTFEPIISLPEANGGLDEDAAFIVVGFKPDALAQRTTLKFRLFLVYFVLID
jgi:hypothetical protein